MQGRPVPSSHERRRPSKWFWALCWALFSFFVAHAAEASEPRATLEIVLVGALAESDTLRARMTSWFDPARFEVRVRGAAVIDPAAILKPDERVTLSIWISVEGAAARLYFASPSGSEDRPRYLLRELELERGLDEIGAERLAEIVHLSALALLEGELTTGRDELERSLGKPAPAPVATRDAASAREEAAMERDLARKPAAVATARRAPAGLDFGVGYGVSFHSDEGVWHGPRASVALRVGSVVAVAVSSAFTLPQTHDLGTIGLRVEAVSLAAGLRLATRIAELTELQWLLGPGVEIVHYTPVLAATRADLSAGDTEGRPFLMTGFAVLVGSNTLKAAFVGELCLSLSRTRYELEAGRERQLVAEPAMLIPRLALEARF
jgi:hypothetical protein